MNRLLAALLVALAACEAKNIHYPGDSGLIGSDGAPETGAVEYVGGTDTGPAPDTGPLGDTGELLGADAKFVATGSSGASVWGGDFDGDGSRDAAIGAPNGGTLCVVSGARRGIVFLYDEADTFVRAEDAHPYAGADLWGGDLDADGEDDLLVGAVGDQDGGAVYFLPRVSGQYFDLASAGARLVGENDNDQAGTSVWGGDLDGDGDGVILVGAPSQDAGGENAGAVYFVSGAATERGSLAAADGKLVGEHQSDSAGAALWGGDLDGDGIGDVLAGAPALVDSAHAGAVYFLSQPPSGTVDLATADGLLVGEPGSYTGAGVWGGDIDGDGRGEVLASAPGSGIYYFSGPPVGSRGIAGAEAIFPGMLQNFWAGDVDGESEILVASSGVIYALHGTPTGTVDLSTAHVLFESDQPNDGLGASLWVGDMDADGRADLLAGAPCDDTIPNGGDCAGAAYLVLGFWEP